MFWRWCQWQRERRTLEALFSLSYRDGELSSYLKKIAWAVSQLLRVDLSLITLHQKEVEQVLASSVDLNQEDNAYSIHAEITTTVVQTGRSLTVKDARTQPEHGQLLEGYRSYVGVPLRNPQGGIIGTICSFHRQRRRFTRAEVRIAEMFAERAATAIDNYYLYQQQQRFNQDLEAEVAKRTEELRKSQARLVEQERLAAIGEFATTIVHEIRNPYTTMKLGLEYFRRIALSEPAQVRLSLALSEANRLEQLLREILLYAKPPALQLTELEMNVFVAAMLEEFRSMPEALGRQIEFAPALTTARLLGDPDKLKQILINVVSNACEAVAAGDIVHLAVDNQVVGKRVCLRIHNGGDPIPPEVLPRLTELFYTTKSSGTGLGLAIVKRLIDAHGGELFIQSSEKEGTTVSVCLPMLMG